MKSRPIIFDGESVRAILGGHKSQTRRVITPQPTPSIVAGWPMWGHRDLGGLFDESVFPSCFMKLVRCPFGEPGDELWVREKWAVEDASKLKLAEYEGGQNPDWVYYRDPVHVGTGLSWRSPMFMPRWASRITLRVTGVRVERVRGISELDCEAELGVAPYALGDSAYSRFRDRWDRINAKRGYPWESNPWVWAVSFEARSGPNQ